MTLVTGSSADHLWPSGSRRAGASAEASASHDLTTQTSCIALAIVGPESAMTDSLMKEREFKIDAEKWPSIYTMAAGWTWERPAVGVGLEFLHFISNLECW